MNRVGFSILTIVSQCNKFHKPLFMPWRCVLKTAPFCTNSLFQSLQSLKFNASIKLNSILNQRSFSSEPDDDGKKPKFLMNFEPVLKPEILLTIKNWILTKLIIQPYLDSEFTLKDFTNGSKQALGIVSSLLSQGDFKSMQGLLKDEAISEIKGNYAALNVKERQDLFIKVADILFAFPYQIGIFFDDANQKRFAEITMVYHCMQGFEELKASGKALTESAKDDIKICNYRFVREYTKGVQSDWTINRLGHFKLRHFEN